MVHMSYDAFLLVMSQLANKRHARISFQDSVIHFELTEKKNHWILYTQVYSGERFLSRVVRSCMSSMGKFRWQSEGTYLKLDSPTNSIYLFQEIQMEKGKFIPFRHYLNAMSTLAAQWREILHDLISV